MVKYGSYSLKIGAELAIYNFFILSVLVKGRVKRFFHNKCWKFAENFVKCEQKMKQVNLLNLRFWEQA